MKGLFFILSFLSFNLYAQQGGFTKILSLDKQCNPSQLIELKNKSYLFIFSSLYDTAVRNKTKLVVFSAKGVVLDSMVFSAPNKDLNIYKVVETAYGVCMMGVMRKDTTSSLWVVNLNKQFQPINEQFAPLLNGEVTDINYTLDRDSTIIMMFQYKWLRTVLTSFGKINKRGEIVSVKNIIGESGKNFAKGIVARKDSARYNFLYYSGAAICDTSFNNWTLRDFKIPLEIALRFSFINSAFVKNDSTYLYAGDITRASYKTNYFFAVMKNFQQTNFQEMAVGGDTSYAAAHKQSVDTTKDGRFIYVGGNYHYQESIFYTPNSYLRLTKMDSSYRVLWTKDYGGDANYRLTGVTATSDGGCIMYAARHNHNTLQQIDVIIIKVDGNGLVTSTNSVALPPSSITAYPNPSNGQLSFKIPPSVFGQIDLAIFDISGKLVYQKKEADVSETYDVSHLPNGNYIYQIFQDGTPLSVGKWQKIGD